MHRIDVNLRILLPAWNCCLNVSCRVYLDENGLGWYFYKLYD
jgi:hypothetical protein